MSSAREDIIKKFCNTSLTFEQLASEVRIEDFVDLRRDAFKGCVLFGVNVRTSSNLENVFPFFYSSINQRLEIKVAPGWTLPKFSDKFGIEDLSFIAINDMDSLSIVLQGGFVDRDREIIEFLSNDNSFVKEQLKVLQQHSENKIFYYWVASADYDISREGAFLANILAVSDCREDIEQCKSRYLALCKLIFLLKARYSFEIEREKNKESIKSAVAAIMTRNMSHNLGSHYLYYTKTHLEKLAKVGGNLGPDLRGASRVLGYMQARMDYLATVISNDRYPYGGVNFKSQIYDELTIDDFSKRHFKDNIKSINEEDKNRIWYNTHSKKIQEVYKKAHEIDKNSKNIDEYKKNVRSYLEGLSSISHDIDAILGNGKTQRTTNFLLANLIKSENFTRSDIMDNLDVTQDRNLMLRVLYKGKGDNLFLEFTGNADVIEEENDVKQKLSRMSFALPGGVMSCHAFFNVVENFIRNSAKYMQDSFKENTNLVVTIAVEYKTVEDIDSYEFTIFDNKQNAYDSIITDEKLTASLVKTIREKLGSLKILDENNKIEKNNKGFKEMLFSTIWMRSYKFIGEETNSSNTTYSDILTKIHSAADGKEKLYLITNYAFDVLAVREKELKDGKELEINLDDECIDSNKYNFGIRFSLPEYKHSFAFDCEGDESSIKNACLKIFGEIVEVEGDDVIKSMRNYFPRIILKDDNLSNTEKLHKILMQRFGEDFDKYLLSFGEDKERNEIVDDQYKIYMERHLSTKEGDNHFAKFKEYAYADSVSGGNFTITLNDWFKKWYDSGRDIQTEEYYNVLKIKEAALTRITIIDERLWDDMDKYGDIKSKELSLRNIRVLNYIENKEVHKVGDLMSIFKGNTFNNSKLYECDETHFLSIHLGLVEKIVKESPLFNAENMSIDQRTELLMNHLKSTFGKNAYISVHSGRGNFSAELENSLKHYPFIGMAALENAYNNSKYLLAQLFYSTVYYGKGALN